MTETIIRTVARAIVAARHPGLPEQEIDDEDGHYWWGLSEDEARAAIEECAKVCDAVAVNAERRAAMYDSRDPTELHNVLARTAALDKMKGAQRCAHDLRAALNPDSTPKP